jgi:hypothetical protein
LKEDAPAIAGMMAVFVGIQFLPPPWNVGLDALLMASGITMMGVEGARFMISFVDLAMRIDETEICDGSQLAALGEEFAADLHEAGIGVAEGALIGGMGAIGKLKRYFPSIDGKKVEGDGLDEISDGLAKKMLPFYDDFVAKLGAEAIEAIEAIEVIAKASSKNELRRKAALSRAKVDELGIVTKSYTNLRGSVADFDGVHRIDDDYFTIADPEAFMKRVRGLYAEPGNPLNPMIDRRILEYIVDGPRLKLFSTKDGIPGLHAEIQAVNDILNKMPMSSDLDLTKIKVATVKLSPGEGQGEPFPACKNCGSILPSSISVLTGVK